ALIVMSISFFFFFLFEYIFFFFFFFQAEDGIRDRTVTGVQTCALPIYLDGWRARDASHRGRAALQPAGRSPARSDARCYSAALEIGRASCRERVEMSGGAVA